MAEDKPGPVGPDATYQQHLAAGEIRIQRCGACGLHVFYPRLSCPSCGARDLAWTEASGAGTVFSTTVMRRRPEQGGDYNVCIVELDEGPRLMSRVEGLPSGEVRIGMKVSARIAGDDKAGRYLVFDPAGEAGHG